MRALRSPAATPAEAQSEAPRSKRRSGSGNTPRPSGMSATPVAASMPPGHVRIAAFGRRPAIRPDRRLHQPEQRARERGLAGAVVADQAEHLAPRAPGSRHRSAPACRHSRRAGPGHRAAPRSQGRALAEVDRRERRARRGSSAGSPSASSLPRSRKAMRSDTPFTMSRLCSMMQIVMPRPTCSAQQPRRSARRSAGPGRTRARRAATAAHPALRMRAIRQELAFGIGQVAGAGVASCPASPTSSSAHFRASSRRSRSPRRPRRAATATRRVSVTASAVLQNRHVVEQLQVLERSARCRRARSSTAAGRASHAPSQPHVTTVGAQLPGDQVEQRRLAGPVGPDQCRDNPLRAARTSRRRPPSARRSAIDRPRVSSRTAADPVMNPRRRPPRTRHQPAGQEDHQQHHRQAVDDLLDRADLGARQPGQVRAVPRAAASAARCREPDPTASRCAADDHHRHQDHRGVEREALGVDEADVEGVERAGHRCERRRHADRDRLDRGDVLAEGRGGDLVVADRLEAAAEAGVHESPDDPQDQRRGRPARARGSARGSR